MHSTSHPKPAAAPTPSLFGWRQQAQHADSCKSMKKCGKSVEKVGKLWENEKHV
jgi:hypothetical protein